MIAIPNFQRRQQRLRADSVSEHQNTPRHPNNVENVPIRRQSSPQQLDSNISEKSCYPGLDEFKKKYQINLNKKPFDRVKKMRKGIETQIDNLLEYSQIIQQHHSQQIDHGSDLSSVGTISSADEKDIEYLFNRSN